MERYTFFLAQLGQLVLGKYDIGVFRRALIRVTVSNIDAEVTRRQLGSHQVQLTYSALGTFMVLMQAFDPPARTIFEMIGIVGYA